jgi:GTP-binding protein Era
MNQAMVRLALDSMEEVDAVLWMINASESWRPEEEHLAERVKNMRAPLVLALNQVDRVRDKSQLLPLMADLGKRFPNSPIYPLCALDPGDYPGLLDLLFPLLPEQEPLFPPELYTDQPERQLAAEVVREHVFTRTRQEIPHCVGVLIESFDEAQEEGGKVTIHCAILVERDSQKPIIIGHGGQTLKAIGMAARKEIQQLLGCGVELRLFVKVRPDWRDNASVLREMGLA